MLGKTRVTLLFRISRPHPQCSSGRALDKRTCDVIRKMGDREDVESDVEGQPASEERLEANRRGRIWCGSGRGLAARPMPRSLSQKS